MAEEILMDADSVDHTAEVLDELLQHTSANALRMSHLDESLGEIRQAVAEVRSAVTQVSSAVQNMPQQPQTGTHQIELDNDTKALKGRVALLMGFSVLQSLALGALMLFALKPMPAPPAPVFVEAPKPAPAPVAPTAAEVTNSENLLKAPAAAAEPAPPPAKPVKKKKK